MGTQNAARREVQIELKGKTYTVRELDLKAYGDMENFVRSQHIKTYRDSAIGVEQALVEDAVMKMVKASYSPEELGEAMSSPGALEFVAYLALRHNVGVTRENIDTIIDTDNIAMVNRVIEGIGEDEEDVNPPEATQEETP